MNSFKVRFRVVIRISGQQMDGVFSGADGAEGASSVSLELLNQKMAVFAKEQNWEQYHSPRNLLLALVGEVGELAEIFQWSGEVPKGCPDWNQEDKVHLREELADVLFYLVWLSDICSVDLGAAALRKIQHNAIKYPGPTTDPESKS